MFYERLHVTFVGVVASLVDSVVVAEFAGYWLHQLLYGDKFPALRRGHLIHHFLLNGHLRPVRAVAYHEETGNRLFVVKIGIEWLALSAILLLFCGATMAFVAGPPVYRELALSTLLGWPIFMFSYAHDRRHTGNFQMTRVPCSSRGH